jgi:hypothetical protein
MSTLEEFDAAFEKARDRLTLEFSEKHKKMSDDSRAFYVAIVERKNRGVHAHAEIWNVAFFLNMAAHDISILVLQLASEHEPWTRKLTARHLALAVYETAEDMTQLLGKPARDALQRLDLLESQGRRLRTNRKPLDSYWQANEALLKEIRVVSIAHREHDGAALFEAINKINVHQILKLGIELGKILNFLGEHLEHILKIIALPDSLRPRTHRKAHP